MSKHTPGPWNAKRLERHQFVIQSESGSIAKTFTPSGATVGEIEANASLIEAAPDLLAALRDLTLLYRLKVTGIDGQDLLAECDAAIAKAVQP